MVHFPSWTDLVDPLLGASILAVTASEKPCSLITVALGANHVALGLDSAGLECVGFSTQEHTVGPMSSPPCLYR